MLSTECPDIPENVTVAEFTARKVSLEWVQGFDSNSQLRNFRLYQQNLSFSNSSEFSLILTLELNQLAPTSASGSYSFVIADTILPFRNYSFHVDACNANGCSKQSNETAVILTLQDSE